MGTIDHFMHPSLLTSSYMLISNERCWEPRVCISYLNSLNQVNVYCSETKLCLHFSEGRRFLLFNYHLCRPQPSDLSGINCHLLNYLYLLTSFLFTHEFAQNRIFLQDSTILVSKICPFPLGMIKKRLFTRFYLCKSDSDAINSLLSFLSGGWWLLLLSLNSLGIKMNEREIGAGSRSEKYSLQGYIMLKLPFFFFQVFP